MRRLCSLCRTPVLGIEGADLNIENYCFPPHSSSPLMELTGPIHSSCLGRSHCPEEYATVMEKYVRNILRPKRIDCCDGGFVARLNTDILIVFNVTHGVRLVARQATNAIPLPDGIRVDCTSSVTISCPIPSSEIQSLATELRTTGIPFRRVLELASVPEEPYESIPLGEARLVPFPDEPKITFLALQAGVFSGDVKHQVDLPECVAKLI